MSKPKKKKFISVYIFVCSNSFFSFQFFTLFIGSLNVIYLFSIFSIVDLL